MSINLNSEEARLQTFHSWNISYINKNDLAMFGFYYYGPSDLVKCHFCHLLVGQWEEGDDILRDHIRYAPNCPLLNRTSQNVPKNRELLESLLPQTRTPDIVGIDICKQKTYDDFYTRFKSFARWPIGLTQKPLEMAKAGFYLEKYTADTVVCFQCNIKIDRWRTEHKPWIRHVQYSPNCPYIKKEQPDLFLNPPKEENIKPSESCCIVCYENETNIVLTPCRHACLCEHCATRLDKCPVCKTTITTCDKVIIV